MAKCGEVGETSFMTISSKQLIRNITSITCAYVGRKALTFIYFTLIARYSGVEVTGAYFLLVSFAAVITSFLDFGFSNTLIREASKAPEKLAFYLNNILTAKIFLSALAIVAGTFILIFFDYSLRIKILVAMLVATMIFETFAETFFSCARVRHHMKTEAQTLVIGQFITLMVGGLSLWLYPSLYLLILALLLNQMCHFFRSYYLVVHTLSLPLQLSFDKTTFISLTKIAIPFHIAVLFEQILYADAFILKYLTEDRIVGLFVVSHALINAFRFIPIVLGLAIFPALSSFHAFSPSKFKKLFQGFYTVLLSLVAPLAIFLLLFSSEAIDLLFGEKYIESSRTLQILALSLLPLFLSYPFSKLLDACNKQLLNATLKGISLVIHLTLTVVLIPSFGAVGIALSCLLSYTFLFLASMHYGSKMLPHVYSFCFKNMLYVMLASCFMGYCLFILKLFLHPFVLIPFGFFLYISSLILLRGMTRSGFNKDEAYREWLLLAKRALR